MIEWRRIEFFENLTTGNHFCWELFYRNWPSVASWVAWGGRCCGLPTSSRPSSPRPCCWTKVTERCLWKKSLDEMKSSKPRAWTDNVEKAQALTRHLYFAKVNEFWWQMNFMSLFKLATLGLILILKKTLWAQESWLSRFLETFLSTLVFKLKAHSSWIKFGWLISASNDDISQHSK